VLELIGKRESAAETEPLKSERCLAARAKTEPAAFGLLYDLYVRRVYGYCFRRLQAREAAEDATSQTFIRALAALPKYREDNPSFGAWLFRIAHNVVIDELRARQLTTWTSFDGERTLDQSANPEESAIEREDMVEFTRALAELSPDQARMVELRLAGLNDREIAFALGKSYGAVRVARHRAAKVLRRTLGFGEGTTPDV
jgi:RNA polymerase sigma-70 factor (ECF subfamily)